jgi:NAD-specific glutamate dehydrogenase
MGIDTQTTGFTAAGIGDMSGDVFGNGMLLSRHVRLVAAFDHRHIFLDPDPAAETSFVERERLFNLPRSSWADYDATKLSAGGGIHARSAKAIAITPQVAKVLATDALSLTPTELISAILKAPVDLLYNGGIGTYVKASTGATCAARSSAKAATSGSRSSAASSTRAAADASTPTRSTTRQASTRPITKSTSRSCSGSQSPTASSR